MSGIATAVVASAVVGSISADKASKRAANAQKGASDAAALQAQIAAEQWDKYIELYEPLEREYVQDAQNYDSPEQFQRAAGEASATVASQFAKARDRLQRVPGMDPSSGAYQSGILGLELGQAAADATQQNTARQMVRDTAYQRQTNALNLGKGLPGTAGNMASNSASTMGQIAASQYGLAAGQAQNAGRFVTDLFGAAKQNGWLGLGGGYNHAANSPGYGAGGGRGLDFSENMQQYGI
jgi:hypothetical protein